MQRDEPLQPRAECASIRSQPNERLFRVVCRAVAIREAGRRWQQSVQNISWRLDTQRHRATEFGCAVHGDCAYRDSEQRRLQHGVGEPRRQSAFRRRNASGMVQYGGGTPAEWFNTAAYADPAPYTYGSSKPNSLVADWGKNVTLSLFRQFHVGLGENRYFEFRAEAFNLFNNVVFGYPDSSLADSNFGRVTSQSNQPRQLQGGLKFYF